MLSVWKILKAWLYYIKIILFFQIWYLIWFQLRIILQMISLENGHKYQTVVNLSWNPWKFYGFFVCWQCGVLEPNLHGNSMEIIDMSMVKKMVKLFFHGHVQTFHRFLWHFMEIHGFSMDIDKLPWNFYSLANGCMFSLETLMLFFFLFF